MITLSKFMAEPQQIHWIATKHVLRYLKCKEFIMA